MIYKVTWLQHLGSLTGCTNAHDNPSTIVMLFCIFCTLHFVITQHLLFISPLPLFSPIPNTLARYHFPLLHFLPIWCFFLWPQTVHQTTQTLISVCSCFVSGMWSYTVSFDLGRTWLLNEKEGDQGHRERNPSGYEKKRKMKLYMILLNWQTSVVTWDCLDV